MYDQIRIREMINGANKTILEHRRSDLRHRGFVCDGQNTVLDDGMSERWTKPIGHLVEYGEWVVTITAHATTKNNHPNVPNHLEYHAKIELSIPNAISHNLTFFLDRLGHRWS